MKRCRGCLLVPLPPCLFSAGYNTSTSLQPGLLCASATDAPSSNSGFRLQVLVSLSRLLGAWDRERLRTHWFSLFLVVLLSCSLQAQTGRFTSSVFIFFDCGPDFLLLGEFMYRRPGFEDTLSILNKLLGKPAAVQEVCLIKPVAIFGMPGTTSAL